MNKTSIVFAMLLFLYFPSSQALVINSVGDEVIEDFSGFSGTGFSPSPLSGQLDSNTWRVTGLSGGAGTFGGTHDTGDFSRGSASGSVSTGGVYSFDLAGSGPSLGVQPTGGDFTAGEVTLRILNDTAMTLNALSVSYDLFILNDQLRSSLFNFSYSHDDLIYTDVLAGETSSAGVADDSPSWEGNNFAFMLSGLNILSSESFYLRWAGDDNSATGSRDQFGLDNIGVTGFADMASTSVPEPESLFLMAAGLLMLGCRRFMAGRT